MWLVAFFGPTNSSEINIKPEWDQAATKLNGKVKMGKSFSNVLAKQRGVTSFPTIMYFPAGDKSDSNSFENYVGDIIADNIVTWALKKHNEKHIGKC